MGMQPILPITVLVRDKRCRRQRYGDGEGVAGSERALSSRDLLFS